MTVSSTTVKSGPYNGNGSTTNFAVNTVYTAKSEVTVIVTSAAGVETTKTLDTHYTLTAPGDSGTVTFLVAPASGETVTILTTLAQTQATDLTPGGSFSANVVEGALDKLTRLVQQIAEKVTRAPKLRQTSTTGEVALPEPEANAFLAWNAAGTNLINGVVADIGEVTATPFIETLLDDANAAEARDTLGLTIGEDVQAFDSDLAAIAALSTTAYGRALLALADDAALQAYIGVREVLTANRTYFIRTDGSDSNDGLANTSGGAFLTIERARQAIYALDLNGFTATAKLADGTYTAGVICNGMPPGAAIASPIIFEGNNSTPANVIISTTSADCFIAQNGANLYVSGVEMRTTTSGSCMRAIKGGQIIHGNVRFGTSAGFHVETADGGRRYNDGNFSIVGGAVAHQHVTSGGFQLLSSCTVTISGTPAFSQYFVGLSGGYAQYTACTFSGSATGIRFLNHEGGVINTDGQSMTTYLPGNAAGVCVNATFDDFYDDLTLAVAGSIDWGTGDVNITHLANQLNFNGASLGYIFDALLRSAGGIKSTSTSEGVGYLTGAGGTVTQLTSKSTSVTLNRPCGQITMNNAALNAGVSVAFAVSNTTVAIGDTISIQHSSGAADGGAYRIEPYNVTTNAFNVKVTNVTGGNLSEAVVLSFQVHKGATS